MQLAAFLCEEVKEGEWQWSNVLDIGCGTGLVGRAFREMAGKLVGYFRVLGPSHRLKLPIIQALLP